MKTITFLLLTSLLLFSCGKNDSSYKYRFNHNGCDTGEKKFGSKKEMCAALQDENLNNKCAKSMREEFYQKNCL